MANRASQTQAGFTGTRQGIITGYDAVEYCIKATLQPTGEETGWIPLATQWAGNGWGLCAGPMVGAEVEINFDSGLIGAGMASGQFYNNEDRCPGPPSGELWVVHQSGSMLKFVNDGTVLIKSATGVTYDAPYHHFTGGDVTMDENLTVVKDIKDLNGSHGTVNNIRVVYNGHTHHENGAGSDTNIPNQPL
jgi:phage gp45-like